MRYYLSVLSLLLLATVTCGAETTTTLSDQDQIQVSMGWTDQPVSRLVVHEFTEDKELVLHFSSEGGTVMTLSVHIDAGRLVLKVGEGGVIPPKPEPDPDKPDPPKPDPDEPDPPEVPEGYKGFTAHAYTAVMETVPEYPERRAHAMAFVANYRTVAEGLAEIPPKPEYRNSEEAWITLGDLNAEVAPKGSSQRDKWAAFFVRMDDKSQPFWPFSRADGAQIANAIGDGLELTP